MNSLAVLAATLIFHAAGDVFLKAQQKPVSIADVERTLLVSEARSVMIKEIELELKPMYAALPKSEDGTLDGATVRYALHRYFVHKYGWYMKGVDPAGAAYNSSFSASIMKEKAPAYIQALFEQRLKGQGMNLHNLALFVAALVDLVHQESTMALREAFEAWNLSVFGEVDRAQADFVSKSYFMTVFLESDSPPTNMTEFTEAEEKVRQVYPAWDDTYLWMQDVRATRDHWVRGKNPFSSRESFGQTASFIEQVGETFGPFQNLECHHVKDKLMALEYEGSGRVRLSQFYKQGLDGDFMFTESTAYLRSLGALDESNPGKPSLVIPNYLTSQTNCLTSSGFYSICCRDQCEGLLAHLEEEIGEEKASPQQIASIVSRLPSDTVNAPRNMSSTLLARLEEVASVHGGKVPLHGRLFAQWMHHVYPRECPFPHISGTINPMTAWDYMDLHGAEALDATEAEMEAHYKAGLEQSSGGEPQSLPWSGVEELISTHSVRSQRRKKSFSMSDVAAVIALLSFMIPLAKMSKQFCGVGGKDKMECHLV